MSFQDELDTMSTDVDSTFCGSVTFNQYADGSFFASTGRRNRSLTVLTITADRGPARIVDDQGFKEEEVMFSALASQFTVRPDAGDEIVVGNIIRKVIKTEDAVNGTWYEITTRRKL